MLTEKNVKECGFAEDGRRYDLIVVGAGPAGFGAAVEAGRRGLKVALIESCGYAGGVATQSCVPLYFGFCVEGRQMTAGLSEEFVRRMDEAGAASLMLDNACAMPENVPIGDRPLMSKVQLQPEMIKLMQRRMLQEAGVECIFYAQMVDCVVEGDAVQGILVNLLEGPRIMRARYFIDATGDALLVRQSGVPVRKYAPEDGMHKSMFFFVGSVAPFNHEWNCEVYRKAFEAGKLPEKVWNHFGYSVQLNPGVVQIAVVYNEGDSLDSRDMSRMDLEMRENVYRVLDFLKKEMPGFSRCYLLETAGKIGVRSGQGIVGMDTFTEEAVACGEEIREPVVLTSRTYGAHGNGAGKKFMAAWASGRSGYSAVPMGSLIPKDLSNVLAAGRCISAEPRIIGVFRMMNTCMEMGEAAGIMTALCAGNGEDLRGLTYSRLRPELDKNGFILQ